MKTIDMEKIGRNLIDLINERDPIDEDIGVLDKDGNISRVIITKDAYEFFLQKVEEEENRIDRKTVDEFHNSGEKEK